MDGDKNSTLHALFTLAMQHGGIWVGLGTLPSSQKDSQRNDINYLGSSIGAIMQSPADASADEVSEGDLETARLFGVRVAQVIQRFND